MKTKWKIFRDKNWYIQSFPNQNVTLLYDVTNGEYEFREGLPNKKRKQTKPQQYKVVNLKKYKVGILVLVGVLGVSLAYNLINILM